VALLPPAGAPGASGGDPGTGVGFAIAVVLLLLVVIVGALLLPGLRAKKPDAGAEPVTDEDAEPAAETEVEPLAELEAAPTKPAPRKKKAVPPPAG
jgi:cytochrome c-type biogenesis protein CcmH/NrfG